MIDEKVTMAQYLEQRRKKNLNIAIAIAVAVFVLICIGLVQSGFMTNWGW
jgi:hypothetical protein